MRLFAAAAALLLLTGCAELRPAEPTALSQGLLIARARVRGALIPFMFMADTADSAAVEQIDEYGNPVPGKQAVSGYAHDGNVYFLDLPRGRYALTSVSFRARGARYEVVLSSAVLRPSAVELRPGSAAFLGELTLDARFPDFDVAVDRAMTVVGHWLTPFLRRPVIGRDADMRTLVRTPEAERDALVAARSDLSQTLWREAVLARLHQLGAPEPAATGGLLGREIPLKQENYFAWRDTLKWGEPSRGAAGLVWRRADGDARVAVFFTSTTAKGFAGYDEAVRQMRAAAGGLVDPAALYEVQVGTRTGTASRTTSFRYPKETLVGSAVSVTMTETVLVPDGAGMYTVRLRAPRDEFPKVFPAYREFLLQLSLTPRPPVSAAGEAVLPR
ncbi:MAG: hypothetical protein ACHQ2Z_02505 [Elusimicrobiota bacterium]